MNKYQTLTKQLEENHAICQGIEDELKTIQPDELWICFLVIIRIQQRLLKLKRRQKNMFQALLEKLSSTHCSNHSPNPAALNTEQQ